MSKRFGRNQKRKLKKEIEELKNTIEVGRKLCNNAMKHNEVLTLRVQRLDRSIKDIASILGKNFAGLNANDIRIDSKFLPKIFQVVVPDRFDNNLDSMMSEDIATGVMQLLNLPVITGEVMNSLMGDIHFILESENGHVGYAISRETLSRMPIDYLTNKIAKIMAVKYKHMISGAKNERDTV
jgi:hypothetical protein